MSATVELDPWQALRSHTVNCNKGCSRKRVVCPVGKLLLTRALKAPEKKGKLKSFPFVAKMYEHIKCNIGGEWIEAVVVDRSLSARKMYKPVEDWDTGKLGPWRTAEGRVVGYEVLTDNKEQHYVNSGNVKSMRVRRLEQVSERKVPSSVGQASRTAQPSDDLIIRRN